MRFIFDCEDEVCLPAAYRLIDEIKPFVDKMKAIEVDETDTQSKANGFKKILENMMVKHPKDTSALLAKLWILEEIEVIDCNELGEPLYDDEEKIISHKEMEKAPNVFKTMTALFSNEVAIDFFTSVLPSIFTISKSISPLLK